MPRKPPARVVVITGASNGPGRAIALEFALHSDALVLASRREGPLDAVRRDCDALHAMTLAQVTDLADPNAAYTLANAALARFKRIDVWINYAPPMPLLRGDVVPAEAFRDPATFDFSGYVNGANAALAVFRALGRGVLINVDALAGGPPEGCETEFAEVRRREQEVFAEIERLAQDVPNVRVTSVVPPRTPLAAETLAPMIVSLATAQSLNGVSGRVRAVIERERFRLWSRFVPPHRHGARPEVWVERSRASATSADAATINASARESAREPVYASARASFTEASRDRSTHDAPSRAGSVRPSHSGHRHGAWHLSSVATTRASLGTIAVLVGIPAIVLAATLMLVR